MALLFSYAGADPEVWRQEFTKHLPETEFRVYPEVGDPAEIEYAAIWMHPVGDLCRYPNLKAILSFGAGVEHIIRDSDLPQGVPIVRLVDDLVVRDMAMHAVHWVIHFHRQYHRYQQDQARTLWQRHPHRDPAQRRVGFLGMGAMGAVAAGFVRELGFCVAGWGRDVVDIEGVEFYQGDARLDEFLQRTDILINVLPLTPATQGLLNAECFAQLPQGACVINISRGPILVEDDLVAALDSGHLEAAALDVFCSEPLVAESPLWRHPKVHVTPHIAGINYTHSAARLMADNIKRIQQGEPPFPIYDPVRGY
ncbi:2-hydroxyacid dehydrogenase [Cobetia amphilecti]|jgi:glyoxylate/hydroxypyruvate reductase A|uniref:2-hydroxyacid dehydrogenase n=1 Tax=Cobetia amphilecti TaxID=1055104 RepID=UPI0026E1C493|nr:glyoxylate/hydroxypyruvate reductase A [Cobetia amphilecti]MDO6815110.1 glyoxylate/hydroxypyruvate reductase A [Cobetia amphilecti]